MCTLVFLRLIKAPTQHVEYTVCASELAPVKWGSDRRLPAGEEEEEDGSEMVVPGPARLQVVNRGLSTNKTIGPARTAAWSSFYFFWIA